MDAEATRRAVAPELAELAALLGRANYVDLAPTLESGIPRWPSHPAVTVDATITHERNGYFCQTLSIPEHAGAHVDAPAHIKAAMMDRTVDAIPVRKLVAPAKLFDLRVFNLGAGELATAAMLSGLDRWSARLTEGEIALVNFGWWERYWHTGKRGRWYSENAPGLSEDACEWLADRDIAAAGADTIGFDIALSEGAAVQGAFAHDTYLLPRNINIMECLANLDKVAERCYFIALPLKVAGGSGSPLRPITVDFRPG